MDTRGWPLGRTEPPLVTNWYKLAANVLVLSAIAAILWWMVKWSWDMWGTMARPLEWPVGLGVANAAAAATMCFAGMTFIVWGIIMVELFSFHVADHLMTQGVQDVSGSPLKRLLLPPLFIAAGLFSLGIARRWLQADSRKIKLTLVAIGAIIMLVAVDRMGESLLERTFFYFLK